VSGVPWLSVVTPVYNGERYLAAALESVLHQSDENVEILVSDDGSSDASRRIIDAYAPDGRIRRLDGPRQGNWVANTNFAVRQTRGRLVTFLHQDDLWLPGRMASLRRALARSQDRALWIGPTRFVNAAGRFAGTWRLPFRSATTAVEPAGFIERLLVQNFIGMPTPVFTRSAFDAVGGMDEQLWYTADWDLWLKLGGLAAVGISPDAVTAFRLHNQSQTMAGASASASLKSQIEIVRARYLPRITDPSTRRAVDRAGRFSCELNANLAAAVGGGSTHWRGLLPSLTGLGMRGAYRFARDARILERTLARLRVGLASGPAAK
jgi:glycosyltransferase involved in cell wall biosynthesis